MNCTNLPLTENVPLMKPNPVCGAGMPASIEEEIADFLDGRTDGEGLLHALYDHVLDEPIPESMRSLLREQNDARPRANPSVTPCNNKNPG